MCSCSISVTSRAKGEMLASANFAISHHTGTARGIRTLTFSYYLNKSFPLPCIYSISQFREKVYRQSVQKFKEKIVEYVQNAQIGSHRRARAAQENFCANCTKRKEERFPAPISLLLTFLRGHLFPLLI